MRKKFRLGWTDGQPNFTPALLSGLLAVGGALFSCSADSGDEDRAYDAEPELLTTASGVAFVRTPDSCVADLPDWSYAPQYR